MINEDKFDKLQEYKLFLDDVREPYWVGNYILPVTIKSIYRENNWDIVRNYKEFTEFILQYGVPGLISFDHDLAEEHYDSENWQDSTLGIYENETGYDCAKWLLSILDKYKLPLPQIICHSMNPVGKENIESLFKNYKAWL